MAGRDIELGIRITADGKVLIAEAGRAEKAIGNIGKTAQEVERNTSALTASFARMGHVAATALGGRELAQAADAWANMNSRIALSSASATDASQAMEGVYRIAQKTGVEMGGLADIYGKVARNAIQYGLSQQDALGVTEALANAVRLSGASAASAGAAMLQFGQALSSGQLRGEELNSILEQTPALAEAVARGMGKTVGDLRKMGEAGELEAGKVLAAIRNEAARLESEVASMTPTIEAAVTRLKNAFTKQIGEESGGAARLLAGGIDALAGNLDKATQAAVTFGAAWGAAKLSAWAIELATVTSAKKALIATELAEAAAAQASAAAQARAGAIYGVTAAQANALAAANARLAAAQTAASSSGIIAMLSRLHPLVIAATGAIVAGSVAYGDWAASAKTSITEVSKDLDALASHIGRVNNQISTMSKAAAQAALADAQRARAVDAGSLDKLRSRYERDFGGDQRQTTRDQIAARDALRGEVMRTEAALAKVDAEIANLTNNISQSGMKAVNDYYANFSSKARGLSDDIENQNAAWNKAAAALAEQGDTAGLMKLKADFESKRAEMHKAAAGGQKAEREVVDATVDAYKDYAKVFEELSGIRAKAIAETKHLTDAEKAREKLIQSGAWKNLSKEAKAAVEAEVARTKALEEGAVAQNLLNKSIAEAEGESAKHLQSLEDKARAMEEEVRYFGMTQGEIHRTIIARLEERRSIDASIDGQEASVEALDREIEARQRLAAAADSKDALDANRRGLEEQTRDAQRAYEQMGQSLTDEIMRGGKSGLDLLKSYSRTVVLRPIVQGMVDAGMSMIGLGRPASGGTSNLPSLFGIGSNVFSGNFASQGFNAIANGASFLGNGAWASGFANAGQVSGAIEAYTASAQAAAEAGLTAAAESYSAAAASLAEGASAASGAPGSIASAAPYIAAALAVISLLSKDGGGPKTEGMSFATVGRLGYQNDSLTGEHGYTKDDADAQINQMLDPLGRGLKDLAIKLGGDATGVQIGLGYNTDPAGTAPDNVSGRAIVNGKTAYLNTYDTERGGASAALGVEAQRIVLASLAELDLNDLADAYLQTLDIPRLSQDAAQQALGFLSATTQVISAFESLGISADDVTLDLINAMGGFDAAASSLGALQQRLAAIDNASATASSSFADAIRTVQMDVLDNAGKYDYLDAEAQRYRDVLASLTDPALIGQYQDKLLGSIMSGWSLLDGAQKQAAAPEFETILQSTNDFVQQRFDAAKDAAKETLREQYENVKQAVIDGMREGSAAIVDAAGSQAASNAAVVDAVSNLHVSVDLSGMWRPAEVGGWG